MRHLMTSLWTARVLVVLGFLAGYVPVGSTFGHIGDPTYSPTHSWHHFFREGFGDLGAMAAILLILFAAAPYRTRVAWWVMLILMIGFYAPFWVGAPFMAELAAPSMTAEIAHLSMAVPSILGGLLAYRHFPPVERAAAQLG